MNITAIETELVNEDVTIYFNVDNVPQEEILISLAEYCRIMVKFLGEEFVYKNGNPILISLVKSGRWHIDFTEYYSYSTEFQSSFVVEALSQHISNLQNA